jgi:hypothetical protein
MGKKGGRGKGAGVVERKQSTCLLACRYEFAIVRKGKQCTEMERTDGKSKWKKQNTEAKLI